MCVCVCACVRACMCACVCSGTHDSLVSFVGAEYQHYLVHECMQASVFVCAVFARAPFCVIRYVAELSSPAHRGMAMVLFAVT